MVQRILQGLRCTHRFFGGGNIVAIPHRKQSVALEFMNAATVRLNNFSRAGEEKMQYGGRLFRRPGFAEGGKITKISAEQGYVAALRRDTGVRQLIGDFPRHITGQVATQITKNTAALHPYPGQFKQ